MKKIKHILFALIFSFAIVCQEIVSYAADLSGLKAGVYTISNDVSHENETGMAMARSYLNESMTLEKTNGSWYYTIKFSGLQYMSNHTIYVNGSKVSHTVKSKNTSQDTIELTFKTNSITPNLKVSMYVSAMGRDVEFGVIPKESTLNLVKATEESNVENSTNSSSNKTDSTNNTSSSSNKTDNSVNSSTKTETKTEEVETESDKVEEETKIEEVVEESEKEDTKEELEETKEEEVVTKEVVSGISESNDENSSNKLIFIGAGSIVVIAMTALVLRKIKK